MAGHYKYQSVTPAPLRSHKTIITMAGRCLADTLLKAIFLTRQIVRVRVFIFRSFELVDWTHDEDPEAMVSRPV